MAFIFQPNLPVRWHWATLTGPDARDFLHRVTTLDARSLEVGHGAQGCLLSPQGKIRAFFTLWHYRPDEFGLEFDGGHEDRWKEALFSAIDQYTFAEKMALTDVTGMESRWILGEDLPETAPWQTAALDDGVRLCHRGSIDFGRPWITAWGLPSALSEWAGRRFPDAAPVGWDELERWRIAATRPWIDHEITQASIPLEAGLLDAIAPNKGCYPGQEVIEKILSLGSPPRRLARLEGVGEAPARGSRILSVPEPPVEIGELTSVQGEGGRFSALGFVRKTHAKEGFELRFPGSPSQATITGIAPHG